MALHVISNTTSECGPTSEKELSILCHKQPMKIHRESIPDEYGADEIKLFHDGFNEVVS